MSPIFHLVDRNAKSRFIGVIVACRMRLDPADRFTTERALVTCERCKRAKLAPEEVGWGAVERKPEERQSRRMQWCSHHQCEHAVEEFTSGHAPYCREYMHAYNAMQHSLRTLDKRRRAS